MRADSEDANISEERFSEALRLKNIPLSPQILRKGKADGSLSETIRRRDLASSLNSLAHDGNMDCFNGELIPDAPKDERMRHFVSLTRNRNMESCDDDELVPDAPRDERKREDFLSSPPRLASSLSVQNENMNCCYDELVPDAPRDERKRDIISLPRRGLSSSGNLDEAARSRIRDVPQPGRLVSAGSSDVGLVEAPRGEVVFALAKMVACMVAMAASLFLGVLMIFAKTFIMSTTGRFGLLPLTVALLAILIVLLHQLGMPFDHVRRLYFGSLS